MVRSDRAESPGTTKQEAIASKAAAVLRTVNEVILCVLRAGQKDRWHMLEFVGLRHKHAGLHAHACDQHYFATISRLRFAQRCTPDEQLRALGVICLAFLYHGRIAVDVQAN